MSATATDFSFFDPYFGGNTSEFSATYTYVPPSGGGGGDPPGIGERGFAGSGPVGKGFKSFAAFTAHLAQCALKDKNGKPAMAWVYNPVETSISGKASWPFDPRIVVGEWVDDDEED